MLAIGAFATDTSIAAALEFAAAATAITEAKEAAVNYFDQSKLALPKWEIGNLSAAAAVEK